MQSILFGDDWIPGGETDSFVVHLCYWMKYEEYTHETMARFGVESISDEVRWSPEQFSKQAEKWDMIEKAKSKSKK